MKKTAYSLFFLMFLFTGCFRIKDSISQIPTNTTSFNAIYFSGDSGTNKKVNAYLVKEINYGGKTLRIWLDYLKYNETNKAEAIKLGQQFLNGNNTNDIYHLLTNVFGSEWGSHSYNDLIQPQNKIDILLTTINSSYTSSGYVMGYFNSLDTILKTSKSLSNEKNMFYMDINLLSGNYKYESKTPTAEEKFEMKKDIYSTLAHEFVHMITWYQKDVLRASGYTETWLNEMLAMMGEDLVDDKIIVDDIEVDGSKMRIPTFNSDYNNYDINDKDEDFDIGDYAINGVYGLYLTRAYGYKSLQFYKDLVQSSHTSTDAIDYATNNSLSGKNFLESLKDFGKAIILSDIYKNTVSGTDNLYYMNRTINDLNISTYNYKFESINIFDYGKFYFLATQKSFKGGANTYLKLRGSSEESGNNEWTITLPAAGEYKISGNFEKGHSIYLVFNNTDINDNSNYNNIVITPAIDDTLVNQNIVGPELNNEKTIIDIGPKLMEKAKENNILNKKTSSLKKSLTNVTGKIQFQIIVKKGNEFDPFKTSELENSVTKIN